MPAYGAEDGDGSEESALGNRQSLRVFCRYWLAGVVQLTNDEEEVMAFPGFRVGWKCIHGIAPLVADKEDVSSEKPMEQPMKGVLNSIAR